MVQVTQPHQLILVGLFDKFKLTSTTAALIKLRSEIDKVLNSCLNHPASRQPPAPSEITCAASFPLLDDPSSPSRKNNIIIHGLTTSSSPDTTSIQALAEDIRQFFRDKLQVDIIPHSVKMLGRAERKPIRVCLKSNRDKRIVFRNCYKLKLNSPYVRIVDDYSYQERWRRKTLYEAMQAAKDRGHQVKIKMDDLYIDGVLTFSLPAFPAPAILMKHQPPSNITTPAISTALPSPESTLIAVDEGASASAAISSSSRFSSFRSLMSSFSKKRRAPQPPLICVMQPTL
jgi:hypothetical protein